jgi:hypothetical protein
LLLAISPLIFVEVEVVKVESHRHQRPPTSALIPSQREFSLSVSISRALNALRAISKDFREKQQSKQ